MYNHQEYIDKNKPQSPTVYDDWRLPTIEELLTLVDYSKCEPASNLVDTNSYEYWSSTAYTYSSCYGVWHVDFGYGGVKDTNRASSGYIRCVRVSENGELQWSNSTEEQVTWYDAVAYAKQLKAPIYYKA